MPSWKRRHSMCTFGHLDPTPPPATVTWFPLDHHHHRLRAHIGSPSGTYRGRSGEIVNVRPGYPSANSTWLDLARLSTLEPQKWTLSRPSYSWNTDWTARGRLALIDTYQCSTSLNARRAIGRMPLSPPCDGDAAARYARPAGESALEHVDEGRAGYTMCEFY